MFPLLLLLGATLLSGQGVPAEWNTRQQLDDLKAKFEAIGPELSRVDLKRWRETGVPEAYLSQFESIQSQLKSLTLAVADLRQAPEKMSVALEIFLRFDALDSMQRPVMEAERAGADASGRLDGAIGGFHSEADPRRARTGPRWRRSGRR